jgi:hypothetical protein
VTIRNAGLFGGVPPEPGADAEALARLCDERVQEAAEHTAGALVWDDTWGLLTADGYDADPDSHAKIWRQVRDHHRDRHRAQRRGGGAPAR